MENHWSKYLVVAVMFMALGPVIFPLLLIATIIGTLYGLGDEE